MHLPRIHNSPTTEQLVELHNIGVRGAQTQNRFFMSRYAENAELFVPRQISGYLLPESTAEAYSWSQRIIGRIAMETVDIWQMHIVDAVGIMDDKTGYNSATRTTYRFVWSDDEVLLARRHLHVPDESDNARTPDMILFQDGVAAAIKECQRLAAAAKVKQLLLDLAGPGEPGEFEALDTDDCEKLAERLRAFNLSSYFIHHRSIGIPVYDRAAHYRGGDDPIIEDLRKAG
jgi:hypothetical protein